MDMDLVSVSACRHPFFSAAFIEEAVFSTSCVFGTFVKN
jgi:hypothetical protein